MLAELRIRDLAIIEHLELNFSPGFNVLTGETGAGKSIIIDAVNLLLGDRASQEVVRSGAERTEVEGTFHLTAAVSAKLAPLLTEHGLEGDQTDILMLGREVRENGRSVARVNGRAVSTALLAEVSSLLVDVHGQGEHLSLLREREHGGLLDRYAGLLPQVAEVAELVRRVRALRRDLAALRQDERERARRIDLLTYQVGEIREARLQPGEEGELEQERRRLANAEQLATFSNEAALVLSGVDGETSGALDALGQAEQLLGKLERIDPSTGVLAEPLRDATAVLTDLARELARYRDAIEFNPRRLQQAEDRLHLIRGLQRKYGDTIGDVLAYAQRAAIELDTISHAEERIADLEAQEEALLLELGRLGAELSAGRRAAGQSMAAAIEAELEDLQMAGARFAVAVSWTPDASGAVVDADAAKVVGETAGTFAFDLHGLDRVVFLVSANPGEPLRPLVKVASGGETSRLMLALKTVLGRADETPTLIFDEIDQGIGGPVGATVGRKLWGLSLQNGDAKQFRHQVLCITHLPQLAAYGDRHFRVTKHQIARRTVTEVDTLGDEAREAELARMLGTETESGRASVAEMMAEIGALKRAIVTDS